MKNTLSRLFTGCGIAIMLLLTARTAPAVTATGGTITTSGIYRIHTFTTNNVGQGDTNFTVSIGGIVDVLLVAGGGGGGDTVGGGGGGGGLLYTNSYSLTAGTTTVAVGMGGAKGASGVQGSVGSNSWFGALLAYGGGGGGGYNTQPGLAGGSGGGGGDTGAGGTNSPSGQGNPGGSASAGNAGGGGGGAGSWGTNATSSAAGMGGAGVSNNISGVWTNYAGGGGGGPRLPATVGTGGIGGGGMGAASGSGGSNGVPHTGGGGGGGGYNGVGSTGGNGGSGIVIVRYDVVNPFISNLPATNVTPTSANLNVFLTSTGTSPTTVTLYWGPTDGGTTAGNWQYTNAFPGTQSIGVLSTNVTFGSSNATYYYSCYAANATGTNWASPSSAFFAGTVTLVATAPNAAEPGPVSGAFTVYRPAIATNSNLAVFYTLSGTAINGTDYQALNGVVTIPVGQISATIPVTPRWTQSSPGSQTVQATLAPGPYIIGPQSNDTVTIADYAAPRGWSGGTNNWTNTSYWIGGVLPGDGEGVTIGSGAVTLTNATPAFAFLIVSNGASLTFDNWNATLTASNVFINGTVTHTPNTATTTNGVGQWVPNARVWFACTNLFVASNGTITADAKGYGFSGSTGYGPGGGLSRGGGGYGNMGGLVAGATRGLPYGSTNAPTDPGSGSMTAGGGAILVQAGGSVTVNGNISANAANASGSASSGSGGSVYITCSTFAGANGVVTATGGTPSTDTSGGGSGGRIAVIYNTNAQGLLPVPTVRFSAGYGYHPSGASYMGEMGTLYFSDASFLNVPVVTHSGELWTLGLFTNWSANAITFSNTQLRIPQTGLVVTVTNDLMVVSTNNALMCKVQLTNVTVTCGGNLTVSRSALMLYRGAIAGPSLTCGGNLVVTNAGALSLYGGITNGADPTNQVTLVSVTGTVRIATNSYVYAYSHPTNGGSCFFQVGGLTVDAGGTLDAVGKGYGQNQGPGRGGIAVTTNNGFFGGSYGGLGGGNSNGSIYGSANTPLYPGSGCGASARLAQGGGLVHVTTPGTIEVNGTITADGTGDQSGGSGGGIYLTANIFKGMGVLSAKGGNANAEGACYGGGGGRIAVWSLYNQANLAATNVIGGWWSSSYSLGRTGNVGTIVMGQLPAPPMIANLQPTNISYTWANLNGNLTSTGTAQTVAWVYWGLSDQGTSKSAWDTNGTLGVMTANQMTLTTNVTGLAPGTNYYYRYYASNSVGDAWAPATTNFTTPAPLPTISNATFGATNVTLTSACLNGFLVATGLSQTAVTVYWGPSDAGTNSGASWAYTNTFAGYPAVGPLSVTVNLPTPNTYYYYRYNAQNSGGQMWADPVSVFMAGEVGTVATAPNASEVGPTPGTITVYRASSMTNLPITVNYAIGGSATLGTDYTLSPAGTSIVMNAGVSNVAITVNPIWDDIVEGTEYVTLTLLPAQYAVAAQSNATVSIADAPVIPGSNGTVAAGDWWGLTNWSKGRSPIAGDDVYIFNDTTITNASRALASLTVAAGKTLTFGGWNTSLSATNIVINGTVTHNPNSATNAPWTPNARVWFICSNLVVATNGSIFTDAKGYGWDGVSIGYGPGRGLNYAGAGYGGLGAQPVGTRGQPYGSTNAPTDPGSGSRTIGGGAVLIQASGTVTVNNAISANGGSGAASGSGGSIYITCNTFAGNNGVVMANGGVPSNDTSGGGGGGRIAVIYDTNAQSSQPLPTVRFSAGYGYHPSAGSYLGDMGTLYFPDMSLLNPSLVTHSGELWVPGLTNWSATSVTFSNNQFRLPQNGLVLSAATDLKVVGTNNFMNKLQLTNATVSCGGNMVFDSVTVTLGADTNARPSVTCGGNLIVTNRAIFAVYGSVTNVANPYGTPVTVSGDIQIATNSWIYPYALNGGSPVFFVYNLTIAAGGGIDAAGKGYLAGAGFGKGGETLYGGGYGGRGGVTNTFGGLTYGSSNAPVDPGSGSGSLGAPGGGVARVKAMRNIQVDGTITADGYGSGSPISSISGGSGGSIYLYCKRFLGAGVLTAKGGNGDTQPSTYGGGGGRIAVWSVYNQANLSSTNILGGVHLANTNDNQGGAPGTIVFGVIIDRGTVWIIQ